MCMEFVTKRGVIATSVAKGLLLHTVAPNKLGYRNLHRLCMEFVTKRGVIATHVAKGLLLHTVAPN